MLDENLIKQFWKISNNNPVINFTKEICKVCRQKYNSE